MNFLEKKILFPSTLIQCINNDQSLKLKNKDFKKLLRGGQGEISSRPCDVKKYQDE